MTQLQKDIVAARQGDAAAGYRISLVERFNPAELAAARRGLVRALGERWEPRANESAVAHAARVLSEKLAWYALGFTEP